MSMNKLINILIVIAVLVLFVRFGIMIFVISLRYWYITIPVVVLLFWKPGGKRRKRTKQATNSPLDPDKEIIPPKPPVVEDDKEEK